MRVPQPPRTKSIDDVHKSLKEVCSFIEQMHANGSKIAGFNQDQVNAMTSNDSLGKTVFNTTTNESNTSYLDTGVVKWRAF